MKKNQVDWNSNSNSNLEEKKNLVEEGGIEALRADLAADQLREAREIYGRIKNGAAGNEDMRRYIDKWRKLETFRMSIGEPYDRQKLWGQKVPGFAVADGDEIDILSDRELIQQGRDLAHDVAQRVKGVRYLKHADNLDKQADLDEEKEKRERRPKGRPKRLRQPKAYVPEEHDDE